MVAITIDSDGNIIQLKQPSDEERARRLIDSTGVYSVTSFAEMANNALLPQARNEFWREFIGHILKTHGDLGQYQHLFRYAGEDFVTYMRRAVTERGSVLWGIKQDIINSKKYRFGHGDFGINSLLSEMDVTGDKGILLDDITFIAVRPSSLEDKIGMMCLVN